MESSAAPAPAQAPVTSNAPIVSVTDMIANVARNTGIAAPAPVEATPTVRFIKDLPLSEPSANEAAPVEAAPLAEAPPAESTEPAGELLIDGGDITLTAQRNPDGTFKTRLDPNEKVDFVIKSLKNPDGTPKAFSKTLPEIVRMAKDSITMQQTVQAAKAIEPEVEYYRANVPKWQQETSTLQTRLDEQMALNRELLSAEDEIVIQHRERYKEEMSPAKQLERIHAERKAESDAKALAARQKQHATVATSFVASRIAPALAAAEAAGLSKYTVTGLVTEITNDLAVNGVIPPANWPEMERRINAPDGPFQKEVKAEAAKRTTESASVVAARAAADAEMRRAQQAVNEVGRQMAPVGRAGFESAPPRPDPKTSTVRGVLDRITNRPLPDAVQRTG